MIIAIVVLTWITLVELTIILLLSQSKILTSDICLEPYQSKTVYSKPQSFQTRVILPPPQEEEISEEEIVALVKKIILPPKEDCVGCDEEVFLQPHLPSFGENFYIGLEETKLY
jgi:hypothetical protein